ncbi:MAG: hypothetical protein PWP23_661 [Candidatus Sumerlaeota bacterium]|nr:hypothetical protein [Candidatus Sumerlaeota bacterium]
MTWQEYHEAARKAAQNRMDDKAVSLWRRALDVIGREPLAAKDRLVVHDAMARFYAIRGRFEESIVSWSEVASTAEEAGGVHRVTAAKAYREIAEIQIAQGKLEEAEQFLVQSLHLWEFHLGGDHQETAATATALGYLQRDIGKYPEAEAHLRKACSFYQKRFGDSFIEVPRLLDNIAIVLAMQERYDEAEKVFHQVFEIWKYATDSKRPDMIKSVNDLAAFYLSSGRIEKAERACRRALHLSKGHWGEENEQAVRSLNILGVCLSQQSNLAEAQESFEQALNMAEKVHGMHHRITAEILDNLTALATKRVVGR